MNKANQHEMVDDDLAFVKLAMQQANIQSDAVSLQTQTHLTKARQQAVDYRDKLAKGNVTVSSNTLRLVNVLRQPKAMLLALILLLLTLVITQQYYNQQQLENSDASLLAAELPPEAFADKGFSQWMELAAH